MIAEIIEERVSRNEFSTSASTILNLVAPMLGINLGVMSIVFSVASFHFLFGLRQTIKKIILGVALLLLDTAFVPRWAQVVLLPNIFSATLFTVLATVFILSYLRIKKKILIFAAVCVILFGILQVQWGSPMEPFYQIIFGLNVLAEGTKLNIFLEILPALFLNGVISVIWGFLVGELVLGNINIGKHYSNEGNRILKIIFFASQIVFIIYLLFLFIKKGIDASPFLNQDPFYLTMDSVSIFLMSIYLFAEIKGKFHEKWDILRLIFLMIGTGFLIPAVYPFIDAIFRGGALIGFLVPLKKKLHT